MVRLCARLSAARMHAHKSWQRGIPLTSRIDDRSRQHTVAARAAIVACTFASLLPHCSYIYTRTVTHSHRHTRTASPYKQQQPPPPPRQYNISTKPLSKLSRPFPIPNQFLPIFYQHWPPIRQPASHILHPQPNIRRRLCSQPPPQPQTSH